MIPVRMLYASDEVLQRHKYKQGNLQMRIALLY